MSSEKPRKGLNPFQKLLFSVAKNLDTDDLDAFKLLVSDEIPTASLEDVKPIVLMRKLVEHDLINEHDQDLLKEALDTIGKKNLIKYVDDYEKERASSPKQNEQSKIETRNIQPSHVSQTPPNLYQTPPNQVKVPHQASLHMFEPTSRNTQPRAIPNTHDKSIARQCSEQSDVPLDGRPPPLRQIISPGFHNMPPVITPHDDLFDAGLLSAGPSPGNVSQAPMLPMLPCSPDKHDKSPPQAPCPTSDSSMPQTSVSPQKGTEITPSTDPQTAVLIRNSRSIDESSTEVSPNKTDPIQRSLGAESSKVSPSPKESSPVNPSVGATKRTPPVGKATVIRGTSKDDKTDLDETSPKLPVETPRHPVAMGTALPPRRIPIQDDIENQSSFATASTDLSLDLRSTEEVINQPEIYRNEDSTEVKKRLTSSVELNLISEEPQADSMEVKKRDVQRGQSEPQADSMEVMKRDVQRGQSESQADSIDVLKVNNQKKHEQQQLEMDGKHNLGLAPSRVTGHSKIATDGPVEIDDEDSKLTCASESENCQLSRYWEDARRKYEKMEKQQQTGQSLSEMAKLKAMDTRHRQKLECDGDSVNLPRKPEVGDKPTVSSSTYQPGTQPDHADVNKSLHKTDRPLNNSTKDFSQPSLSSSKLHTDSPLEEGNQDEQAIPNTNRGSGARPKTSRPQQENAYSMLQGGKPLKPNPARLQAMLDDASNSIRRMALSDGHNLREDEQLMRAAEVKRERLRETRRQERERRGKETIQLYGYQLELAQPALDGHNCILCAPTGSGKTFTAGYICEKLWDRADEQNQPFRALFIVCIRNLINQQTEALRQLISAHDDRYSLIEGINETAKLKELLQTRNVVVLTAQILVNSLRNKEMSLRDIDLLIMDECHHTIENHPYNVIMKSYHEEKRKGQGLPLPQILGLTASLGVGANKDNALEHYIRMCANLDCTKITHVRDPDNHRELLKQNPKPQKNQIIGVNPRDKNELFVIILQYMMREIETNTESLPAIKPQRMTQHYENWIVQLRKSAEENDMQDAIYCCKTLQKLNTALMLFDEIRAKDVLPILDEHFAEEHRSEAPPRLEASIQALYDAQKAELWELAEKEQLSDNQKLQRLAELLADLFTCQPESKGILLTRMRTTVEGLRSFVADQRSLKGLVRPAKFVGQGRKEGTMTDVDQELTLISFRQTEPDSYNLLVATDVAQEGLDMPQCNFVIRYNFVSNEIGSVQSRGRARAKNSECYLIVNRNSAEQVREYENLQKEHVMMEALEDIVHIDQAELHRHIREAQDHLYKRELVQRERKAITSSQFDVEKVKIHCKNCKEMLCEGRDMRKRGTSYIATATDFERKVTLRKYSNRRDFRYDYHIGDLTCVNRTCNRKVGLQVCYKEGTRQYGYVLSKDAVMWRYEGEENYRQVKQWSKVPFHIREEELTE